MAARVRRALPRGVELPRPEAVAACTHEDVVWIDPALDEPAIGRGAVADFARSGFVAFPDLVFSELGEPAIAADERAAYVPWLMTGTNTGPIDPPGSPRPGSRSWSGASTSGSFAKG